MPSKKAVLDELQSPQAEVTPLGVIQLRILKQVVGDDGKVVFDGYHRTTLEPGVDVTAQMDAVNAHLTKMGYGALSPEDMGKVNAKVQKEHTPAKKALYAQAMKAQADKL
jgi:hypothetical protein